METTLQQPRNSTIPMGTLHVDVISGPGAGLGLLLDSDIVTVGSADGNSLVLPDATVSRFHLELTRTNDRIVLADLGSTNGTYIGRVRIDRAYIEPDTVVALGNSTIRISNGSTSRVSVVEDEALAGMVGQTAVMRRTMAALERAARGSASVLLSGESGTGKEVAARALHLLGPRSHGPFVTLDCGAIAPSLLASEIFGHERGAFTGADKQQIGVFERANGGTVFLDEIGELPLELQVSLLGVLERRRFRRVGGKTEIPIDVRIVSATNRELRTEVNEGNFRLDLYYRLAVVVVRLPSLRERIEDIPMLVAHFMRELGQLGLPQEVFGQDWLDGLARQRWQGNVRELRNAVESALVMGTAIEDAAPGTTAAADVLPYKVARANVTAEFERGYVAQILALTNNVITHAARLAQMDRSHLIELVHRHGLKRD